MKPQRIQRKRTKGFKLPKNTIYIGRPTKWGNPFKVGDYYNNSGGVVLTVPANSKMFGRNCTCLEYKKITPQIAVDLFVKYTVHKLRKSARQELKGKNLACFCPLNKPCHADILLEIVNSDTLYDRAKDRLR